MDVEIKQKSGPHPCEPDLNSVCEPRHLRGGHTKPSTPNKITMPTSRKNLQTRRFTLFSMGDSYVDVPPLTRFLHIENNNQDKPVLVCQVDADVHKIEWRRVVCVPTDKDLRRYAGWYGIPRLSGANLWFLDPKVYDHNAKPIEQ